MKKKSALIFTLVFLVLSLTYVTRTNVLAAATYNDLFEDPGIATDIATKTGATSADDTANMSAIQNISYYDYFSPVQSLKGFENLTGIQTLYLSSKANTFTDVSFLSNLTNLANLTVGSSQVESIVPLSGLTNLSTFNFRNSLVHTIPNLSAITSLKNIDFSNNKLTNIDFLVGSTSIRSVVFKDNPINDITPLFNLPLLGMINIGNINYEITDLSTILDNLPNLYSLSIDGNEISDLTSLETYTNAPMMMLSFASNKISELPDFSNFTNISILDLSANSISDISTIGNLFEPINQGFNLYLDENKIEDISPVNLMKVTSSLQVSANNQQIERAAILNPSTSYSTTNSIKDVDGLVVEDITNILPNGSYTNPTITWSNINDTTTNLSYNFESNYADMKIGALGSYFLMLDYSGTVSIPITRVAQSYRVDFDSQGGTAVAPITDIQNGDVITEPAKPTKQGYVFKGWHTESSTQIGWKFDSDVVVSNMTLYAKWEQTAIEKPSTTDGKEMKSSSIKANDFSNLKYFTFVLGISGIIITSVLVHKKIKSEK